MDSFTTDISSKGANHRIRKLLGRAYLRENRIAEALEVYLGILKDSPNDADVMLVLGNLYRLAGMPDAAACLYSQVLKLSAGDRQTEKQASLLPEEPGHGLNVQDVLSEQAIQNLIARLQICNTPVLMEKIRTAAETQDRTAPEERIAETNGQGTEDVQQLLPALIQLNIRQARAAGYPDLAEALQSLQINLTRHVDDRWADDLLRDDHMLENRSPSDTE